MTLVLGLNSTHPDSSAVLMSDKGVLAAICEERINRKKHCPDFPRLAIQEVLRIAGAGIEDVTDLAIARQPKANMAAKLGFVARNPVYGARMAMIRLGVYGRSGGSAQTIAEQMGVEESRIRCRFHKVEHHLAHIASAFFWSGFDRATGISTDGSGDFATSMFARCEGNKIDILHRSFIPNSLGVYYTGVCHFLGFDKYGEEYKVMGLSAYGQPKYVQQIADFVRYSPGRGIRLNNRYFKTYTDTFDTAAHHFAHSDNGEVRLPLIFTEAMQRALGNGQQGGGPRRRGEPMTQFHSDIACSMQRVFEEVYCQLIADGVAQNGGLKDTVMAGGCVLNGVGNGVLLEKGIIDRTYIHPAAGDDGTAAGAAAYVLHSVLGVPRAGEVSHAYWGTGYTDQQCENAVNASGLPFRRLSRQELIDTAAESLSRGAIIGWFQGREEWGPRALGNRSILCNPGWPDMKAILNARVKNREPFRPFAPAILAERLSDCYEGTHEVPFMNIVYKTRPEWRERLSATTHEDHTGRVQTVRRDQNELYYDLIKAFEQRTGIPVLLNTSFNENEPIVHTPEQAIDCFKRTRMNALAVGPFWYEKPESEASWGEAV